MIKPLVLLCISLFCATALADSASFAEARRHYQLGTAHYDLGDFDGAIEEYKKAYEISAAPRLLFNLAQAYRLKKDYAQALTYYRSYLQRDPNPRNAEDVDHWIAEIGRSAAHPPSPLAVPEAASPPPAAEAQPAPSSLPMTGPHRTAAVVPKQELVPPVDRSLIKGRLNRRLTIAGTLTGASGIVLVATGAIFSILAASASNEISRLSANDGAWSQHFKDVFSNGERYDTASIALYSVGGAAVVAGGILTYLGLREHGERRLALVPVPNGVGLRGVFE